jgi:hypothetical protein
VNTIYDLFFPQMLRNFKDTGGYEVVISCPDAVQAAQTFIAWLQQSNANERSVSRAKQIITKTNMQQADAFLAYIYSWACVGPGRASGRPEVSPT